MNAIILNINFYIIITNRKRCNSSNRTDMVINIDESYRNISWAVKLYYILDLISILKFSPNIFSQSISNGNSDIMICVKWSLQNTGFKFKCIFL